MPIARLESGKSTIFLRMLAIRWKRYDSLSSFPSCAAHKTEQKRALNENLENYAYYAAL